MILKYLILGVTSSNPDTVAKLANSTAKSFQQKSKSIMYADNSTVISRAVPSNTPISSNKTMNLLIGAIVGLLVGILLALIKEYNAKTIENTEFITDDFKLTNLGIVNDINSKNK